MQILDIINKYTNFFLDSKKAASGSKNSIRTYTIILEKFYDFVADELEKHKNLEPSIIESVFNILKNKLQLCHTRHRSIFNFISHITSVLIGCQLFCNKPKFNLQRFDLDQLA